MKDRGGGLIARERLDTLVDGVFAFSMTLLVVNVELPDDFRAINGSELLHALLKLQDTFLGYVITFAVLGSFWIWRPQLKGAPVASASLVWSLLAHLFFVTLMPFSMGIIARYSFAPAIWLYRGNMLLLALTGIGVNRATSHDTGRQLKLNDISGYILLIATAILSIVVAAFKPDYVKLAYLVNVALPLMGRRTNTD